MGIKEFKDKIKNMFQFRGSDTDVENADYSDLDSLARTEMILYAEETLGISLNEDDLKKVQKFEDIEKLVNK